MRSLHKAVWLATLTVIGTTGATIAISAAAGGRSPTSNLATCPLHVPSQVTGRYGERRPGHIHAGIDLAAPAGTPIYSPVGGTIRTGNQAQGAGNYTVIDGGGGLTYWFMHQRRFTVTGGSARPGDQLGEVGSTGHSSGPHLHYEVRSNGRAVDPAPSLATACSQNGNGVRTQPAQNVPTTWKEVGWQLRSGQKLSPGESMVSSDGRYRLDNQADDGNIVLYQTAGHRPLWATGTRGLGPVRLEIQSDGNVVAYTIANGRAVYTTGTAGAGSVTLELQNDGNLVTYALDQRPVAASNTRR